MKVIFLNNSFPIPTRTQKIYNSLLRIYKNDLVVKFIAWDRLNYNKTDKDNYIFSSKEGYGNKIKKIFGLLRFGKYSKKVILKERPDVIITRHWDMFILAKIISRDCKIIYDICDMPYSSNKIVHFLINQLEKLLLYKGNNNIIFASRFFSDDYRKINTKKIILENKIDLLNEPLLNKADFNKTNKRLSVAFIGAIRYYEILKNLIDAAEGLSVDLNFYGIGSDSRKLENYCDGKENISIHGRFHYEQINEFYNKNDIIWAAYPFKDLNVKKAISNKHFEAILFNKPCVYSKETELGNYCEEHKLGYVVDPYNTEEIRRLLIGLINDRSSTEKIIESIENYKMSNDIFWKDYDNEIRQFFNAI